MKKKFPYNAVNVLNVAVAYARYSSNNQREESIDAQLRAIRDYCERNGIMLVETYQDEAQTGKNDDRENFQRMIADIMKGHIKIDTLLVHKFNRFARNKIDSAIHKKRLKDIGVRVVSVTQPIDDSPEGALLESLIEAMDEYYSANLALEVKKGLKENALKGKHTGGNVAFGYSVDNEGRYVPNDNAFIVKRIFEEYAAEVPKTEICERLNNEGLRNQLGNLFNVRTVYDMLRNEKYIGNYIYKLGNETIRLEGIISPAIIDMELWHRVQKLCNQPVKARMRHQKARYFLTGKTICGECGASICGAGSKRMRDNTLYYYYKCVGKTKNKNGCKNASLNKDWYENNVMRAVMKAVMNEEQIKEIARLTYEELQAARQTPAVSTASLKKELSTIKNKQEKLTELYLEGSMDKEMLDRKNGELIKRKYVIETELEKRSAVDQAQDIDESEILNYVKNYIEKLKSDSQSDEDFMRAIFNAFVQQVIVTNSAITVMVNADFSFFDDGDNRKRAGPAPPPARDKSIRSIKHLTQKNKCCQQILTYFAMFKIPEKIICN
ncbi:recombinase family protein [Solibacillus silvestris]